MTPDNELRVGSEKEKEKVQRYNRWDEQKMNRKKKHTHTHLDTAAVDRFFVDQPPTTPWSIEKDATRVFFGE